MRRGMVIVEKAIRAFAHDRNHNITQKQADRRERRGCIPPLSSELETCSMMDDVPAMFAPVLKTECLQFSLY